MKILMVLTSHDQMGDTDRKTGFWLEEFAAPYYVFKDAGADITLASPKGGQPPLDPASDQEDSHTDATRRFRDDLEAQRLLANTVMLSNVGADTFDAVFYPGGHGPSWDLPQNKYSINLIETMNRARKPIGAVCHAPAVLLRAAGENEKPLLEGRKATGFTNSEEEAVGLLDVVPFSLEDEMKRRGADFQRGDNGSSFAITDRYIVTGQNPASSTETAEAMLELLH